MGWENGSEIPVARHKGAETLRRWRLLPWHEKITGFRGTRNVWLPLTCLPCTRCKLRPAATRSRRSRAAGAASDAAFRTDRFLRCPISVTRCRFGRRPAPNPWLCLHLMQPMRPIRPPTPGLRRGLRALARVPIRHPTPGLRRGLRPLARVAADPASSAEAALAARASIAELCRATTGVKPRARSHGRCGYRDGVRRVPRGERRLAAG